ncbi:MAG: sugar lactone lactonase YvrE [Myxococcota bacterium]|jgi:sugar lactone lactonase YvrE
MASSKLRILALMGVSLGALGGLYLAAWPVPIEPVAWQAPPGVEWHPTGSLASAQRVPMADGYGPEDVHVLPSGDVIVGSHDGTLWRHGDEVSVVTDGLERPLGIHGLPDGRLVVADALLGLVAVDVDTGAVEVLTTTCGGAPLVFTDDVDVAADGTIWFTDATQRFQQSDWMMDILESGATGRLCSYQIGDVDAQEHLTEVAFANGIALDPAGAFVLVNETSRYRVRRLWLSGPNEGTDDVFVDDLPGFPDGISAGDGVFWIAIASPRNGAVDTLAGHPWLRKVLVRLPEVMLPAPLQSARAIALDASGAVVHDLYDPVGERITTVTSVQEHDGRVYLGSLVDTAWAVIDIPD